MSAFVVTKQHIDALVTVGLPRPGETGWIRWQDPTEPTVTHRLNRETADRAGSLLWQENRVSVNHRYHDGDPVDPEYQFQRAWHEPVVALKLIDCYEYQSCEHDGWDESQAKRVCDQLRKLAVSKLPATRKPRGASDPLPVAGRAQVPAPGRRGRPVLPPRPRDKEQSMTSTASPTAPTSSGSSPQASTPLSVVASELAYLAAKLDSIRDEFGDQLDDDLAHDLHSAWDSVQVAQAALSNAPSVEIGPAAWPDGVCTVDIDQFTARWDRANGPISRLMDDKAAWAVAEWAAARARYELAFVDAMRPAPASCEERSTRLSKAEVELERACKAVGEARVPAVSSRPRRRR